MFSLLENKDVSGLTKNEALVLIKYYNNGKKLEDIGEEIGVSRQRVQQLRLSAIHKLRFLNNIHYLLGKTSEPVVNDSLDMLGLTTRTYNILTNQGINSINTLRKMGYESFFNIKGIGKEGVAEIVNCLINYK